MNVVDSSAWIEFLQGTPRAPLFAPALNQLEAILVPAISLFEVHRLISLKQSGAVAEAAITHLRRARVADLDGDLAVAASRLARVHKLSLADAIIYATAQAHGAELWKQDAHFKGLPGVKFFPKP